MTTRPAQARAHAQLLRARPKNSRHDVMRAATMLDDLAQDHRSASIRHLGTVENAGAFLCRAENAERRGLELEAALTLALDALGLLEPTDSRAVSDQYVAMSAICCGVEAEGSLPIVLEELDRRENPNAARLREALKL